MTMHRNRPEGETHTSLMRGRPGSSMVCGRGQNNGSALWTSMCTNSPQHKHAHATHSQWLAQGAQRRTVTGASATSQSQNMTTPSMPPVTSSCSLSTRCDRDVKPPAYVLDIWMGRWHAKIGVLTTKCACRHSIEAPIDTESTTGGHQRPPLPSFPSNYPYAPDAPPHDALISDPP